MWNQVLSYAVVIVTLALTLITLIMALGRNERSLRIFMAAFSILTACFLLFPLQEHTAVILSIMLSNVLLVLFYLFMVWGIRTFYGQTPAWSTRFWAYLGLTVAAFAVFTYAIPDFTLRAILSSLVIILLVLEFIATLYRHSYDTINAIRIPMIVCFSLSIPFHAFRLFLLVTGNFPADGLMLDNPVTTITFSFTIFSNILWAGGIILLDNAKLVSDLVRKNMMLENLALKDELTGLFNRHSLDQTIVAEMQRQNRYQEPVSLIMLDLDHFKNVNDRYGHDAGDVVLVEAARRVIKGIRATDFLFRWGGEEFLILMPNTNLEGAGFVAEKLRCGLLGAPVEPVGTVTASFGVAERMPGESREDWFRHVDQAMYRAKRAGRNRVELWKPGNDIPVATVHVEWQKEWNSGNKAIDRDHQEIIRIGNDLLQLAISGKKDTEIQKIVESLIVSIKDHFRNEEEILAAAAYPDLDRHRQIHQTLYAEAREMQESYAKGKTDAPILFDYIVHKLILSHILSSDVEYFPYVRKLKNGKGY